ncbi:hypothetical protein CR513_06478, partial [Mucuna pruriens]
MSSLPYMPPMTFHIWTIICDNGFHMLVNSGRHLRQNSLDIKYIGSIRTSLLVRLILTSMRRCGKDLFKAD